MPLLFLHWISNSSNFFCSHTHYECHYRSNTATTSGLCVLLLLALLVLATTSSFLPGNQEWVVAEAAIEPRGASGHVHARAHLQKRVEKTTTSPPIFQAEAFSHVQDADKEQNHVCRGDWRFFSQFNAFSCFPGNHCERAYVQFRHLSKRVVSWIARDKQAL